MAKGQRYRRPNSTCIAYIGWQAQAVTIQSGKRQIAPGSLGVCDFTFRRKYPRYHYVGRRMLLRYDDFMAWARSASPGTVWNDQYKGVI
jgi:hypothetical protein